MNNGRRIIDPNQPMQAPAPFQVAAPLNDVQLVAMVAAQVNRSHPSDRVDTAVKIVAKSVVTVMFSKSLEKEVQRLLDEQRTEQMAEQQQQQSPEQPNQSPCMTRLLG